MSGRRLRTLQLVMLVVVVGVYLTLFIRQKERDGLRVEALTINEQAVVKVNMKRLESLSMMTLKDTPRPVIWMRNGEVQLVVAVSGTECGSVTLLDRPRGYPRIQSLAGEGGKRFALQVKRVVSFENTNEYERLASMFANQ